VITSTTAPPRAGAPPIRRVVLVDDHRMFTEALAVSLSAEPDLLVVDRCTLGEPDLISRVAAGRPDVVVVDPDGRWGEPRGAATAELVSGLVAACAGVRVLALTAGTDRTQLIDAMRAGAAGWLGKDSSPADLLAALRAVCRGDACLSPTDLGVVLRALRAELDPADRRQAKLDVLSRQERRVLAALVDGASGAAIASALRVSEGTVRAHLHNVFGKLGVHSRLEAVSVARAAGMRPGAPADPDDRAATWR
jgi:DNA-binding NarL/FixJ family response regulator